MPRPSLAWQTCVCGPIVIFSSHFLTFPLSRALTNFSAAKLHRLLARLDVNRLAEELASRPQYVARLFNTLLRTSKMSRDGAIALAELGEPENHKAPGLSDKTRRKLERALRIK